MQALQDSDNGIRRAEAVAGTAKIRVPVAQEQDVALLRCGVVPELSGEALERQPETRVDTGPLLQAAVGRRDGGGVVQGGRHVDQLWTDQTVAHRGGKSQPQLTLKLRKH